MKFALVFISPNGTTESTSQVLQDIIIENGHQVEILNIGLKPYRDNHRLIFERLQEADIVGWGSCVYHMDILEPMQELLKEIASNTDKYNYNFKSFIYLNYAGITSGKAFANTLKTLKEIKVPVIGGLRILAPHLHHDKQFPTEKTKKIVEKFYHRLESNKFAAISWNRARKLFAPEKFLVNIIYPFVDLLAQKRQLPINIKADKCEKCEKCVNQCPVGAMEMKGSVTINFNECIHCYHCVVSCPFGAIECPLEKLDDMIAKNKKIIGTEDPANKIFI